ncbi:hypothetical protein [Lacipirellula limnantheis]|uniref:hypothetical protein n=1 Tax=Lacipirellula limnantheis TaxID=2528024 RepID=UPI00143D1C8D|nr:hypothetical protein [Lacipirellula limnantheis]
MEHTLVAQQTGYIRAKPISISLFTILAVVVYVVLWRRKRKARRQLKSGTKRKLS